MKITKYVHATFKIETKNLKILIDPGTYTFDGGRFNLGKLKLDYFKDVDILILTHTHADHYYQKAVLEINKICRPKIICNFEVSKELNDLGIENILIKEGDVKIINGIEFKGYFCNHFIPSIAFTINDGENILYYLSDTVYKEVDTKADVLIVPIGNRDLVMSPLEAARFTSKLKPKLVIPMHYESPKDFVLPDDFLKEIKIIDCKVPVKIMKYKEEIDLGKVFDK